MSIRAVLVFLIVMVVAAVVMGPRMRSVIAKILGVGRGR